MAQIDLTLSLTKARVLRDLLAGNCTNKALADLYEELNHYVEQLDAIPVAPFRKVVGKRSKGIAYFEDLECGHSYMLRTSKNWIEEHATRRRCKYCLRAQQEAVQ